MSRLREIIRRIPIEAVAVVVAIGSTLSGLWVGYGPISGDPDRLYRPIKRVLAEALRSGTLPFWSDRFGLGVPLIAESHVAAFYPWNWVAYRFLDVDFAYGLSMWLHHIAVGLATYFYAKRLALTPWGAALAAVSFTLSGFAAIHASHEPFYYAMPYLPLALWKTEGYLEKGGFGRLAGLAAILGVQILVGHFQIQFWTIGLVLATGLWRTLFDRRPARRLLGLLIALAWAGAIASVQLKMTYDYAQFVGQTRRSTPELSFYAFPPAHFVELILPRLFRELPGRGEDRYWAFQGTAAEEACFYVGAITFLCAGAGLIASKNRRLGPWYGLVPAALVMATMPQWWPSGYEAILRIPGLGFFRAPARYTLIAGLGLALFGGRGLDSSISSRRFAWGLGGMIALAVCLLAVVYFHSATAKFGDRLLGLTLPRRVGAGVAGWIAALVGLWLWRTRRVGGWLPFAIVSVELGLLFLTASPDWGWPLPKPKAGPILTEIATSSPNARVGGRVDDLPILAGLTTADPYLGMQLPEPHWLLRTAQLRAGPVDPTALRWLRRFGVTHAIYPRPVEIGPGERIARQDDFALDLMAFQTGEHPTHRDWFVVTLADPMPQARVAIRSRVEPNLRAVQEGKSLSVDESQAWYIRGDVPPTAPTPAARPAKVVSWDGRTAVVEHDGACHLILARTFVPGWSARVDDGPEMPVYRVDGGLQAIPIDGTGRSRVSVRYAPAGFKITAGLSALATVVAIAVMVGSRLRLKGSIAPETPKELVE